MVSTDDVGSVITQPLYDANIMQEEIPPVLVASEKSPYAAPSDCAGIASEIGLLDKALGPDLDEQPLEADAPLVSYRGAGKMAVDTARGAALGLIPFRGAIRTVSGADRHADALKNAALAGTVRRAYLKGFGEKLGCARPAAPLRGLTTAQ